MISVLLIVLPFLGQTADVWTTERALKRGAYETNQYAWAQNTKQRRIVKAVIALAMSGAMYYLLLSGVHIGIRVLASVLATGTGLIPAVINISRTR